MLGSLLALPGRVAAVPGRVAAVLSDIHRVAENLDAIRALTASMDDEVRRMRAGVDELGVQVYRLREDVDRRRLPRRRPLNGGQEGEARWPLAD